MSADVSVRLAWGTDAYWLAQTQVRAWKSMYADLMPTDLLASLRPEEFQPRWLDLINKPTDARQRVLVALDSVTVVGYTITSPGSDPDCNPITDGEMEQIVIEPDQRGHGHGSRLMQAAVDTMRSDHFTRALTWVNSGDDATLQLLIGAGWAADGAHRTVDLGGSELKQVRLHTQIAG